MQIINEAEYIYTGDIVFKGMKCRHYNIKSSNKSLYITIHENRNIELLDTLQTNTNIFIGTYKDIKIVGDSKIIANCLSDIDVERADSDEVLCFTLDKDFHIENSELNIICTDFSKFYKFGNLKVVNSKSAGLLLNAKNANNTTDVSFLENNHNGVIYFETGLLKNEYARNPLIRAENLMADEKSVFKNMIIYSSNIFRIAFTDLIISHGKNATQKGRVELYLLETVMSSLDIAGDKKSGSETMFYVPCGKNGVYKRGLCIRSHCSIKSLYLDFYINPTSFKAMDVYLFYATETHLMLQGENTLLKCEDHDFSFYANELALHDSKITFSKFEGYCIRNKLEFLDANIEIEGDDFFKTFNSTKSAFIFTHMKGKISDIIDLETELDYTGYLSIEKMTLNKLKRMHISNKNLKIINIIQENSNPMFDQGNIDICIKNSKFDKKSKLFISSTSKNKSIIINECKIGFLNLNVDDNVYLDNIVAKEIIRETNNKPIIEKDYNEEIVDIDLKTPYVPEKFIRPKGTGLSDIEDYL